MYYVYDGMCYEFVLTGTFEDMQRYAVDWRDVVEDNEKEYPLDTIELIIKYMEQFNFEVGVVHEQQ